MKSASTGTPAVLRSLRNAARKRAGFTLIEALVALALVLAFAAALGPYMFQARRIMSGVDNRIAAQILLRSLIDAPFERTTPPKTLREGETAGLRWRITTEPMFVETLAPRRPQPISPRQPNDPAPEGANWAAFRVVASVSWDSGTSVSAETVRLGKAE